MEEVSAEEAGKREEERQTRKVYEGNLRNQGMLKQLDPPEV